MTAPNAAPSKAAAAPLAQTLRADFVAGLTVAILGVPQGMAYAMIAGLPPILGLYTSIASCIVGAAFGSSRHLVTGPTNASCMVLFSIAAPYMQLDNHLEIILLVTFLTGFVKLAFGLLRMGSIVRYVSNSVVIGFTSGVAVLIVGNQLANVLGITLEGGRSSFFFKTVALSLERVGDVHWPTLGVAAATIAVVLLCKRLSAKLPGPLIAIVATAFGAWALGLTEHGVRTARDLGSLSAGSIGWFHVPDFIARPGSFDFQMALDVLPGALAVAIFGLIEASTSSRAVAALSGQRLNFSRDFVAQGAANLAGVFFWNFASSGSFVRTALCYQAGGRTRMAPIFSGLLIAALMLFFGRFTDHIPQATLAGMLFYVAFSMIAKQRKRLSMTWKTGGASRAVLFSTLAATLMLPLQYAIFVGVFLSIFFLLKITARPDLTQLVPRGGGRFDEVPFDQDVGGPILLVNLAGPLYFAAVENLDYQLQSGLRPDTQVVILRMKRLRAAGSSAMAVLEHFWQMLREKNVDLVACGLERELARTMINSGVRDRIGEQNIFYADNTLFQSTELALARARAIVDMHASKQETEGRRRETATPKRAPRAGDLMSRRCIRFGEGHTMREAVWLLSEMTKGRRNPEGQPLFLQDARGKLAGKIGPRRMLEAMTECFEPGEMKRLDDAELGKRFRACFPTVVGDIARRRMPLLETNSTLGRLVWASQAYELRTLPVRDAEGRLAGLVCEEDLLRGFAEAVDFPMPETPKPESL